MLKAKFNFKNQKYFKIIKLQDFQKSAKNWVYNFSISVANKLVEANENGNVSTNFEENWTTNVVTIKTHTIFFKPLKSCSRGLVLCTVQTSRPHGDTTIAQFSMEIC